MPIATASEETIDGTPGVRFRTDARPDARFCPQCSSMDFERLGPDLICRRCESRWAATKEHELQEIQAKLGGEPFPGTRPTLPHLSLKLIGVVDGPDYSVISLWVSKELRSQAAELLQAAGFEVRQ